MEEYRLICGDALDIMKELSEEGVTVDAVITDPPYGVTSCSWDTVIPFDDIWESLKLITKSDSAVVLFGTEPFSSQLRCSNLNDYKYDWIWRKPSGANPFIAKYQPMNDVEMISVFYKEFGTYNPQMTVGVHINRGARKIKSVESLGGRSKTASYNSSYRYPKRVLDFKRESQIGSNDDREKNCVHPTQKPTALMEYLVKTYTNVGDTVLDFTMGSGSTGVACVNTNRRFIGIEIDKKYVDVADYRIKNAILNRKAGDSRQSVFSNSKFYI